MNFDKYSSILSMPNIVLGTDSAHVSKIEKVSALLEFLFLGRGTRQYTSKQTSAF